MAVALATGGCGGNDASLFPPGLMPFNVSTLAPPAATSTTLYPEAFTTNHGTNGDTVWVHGMAYVNAPLSSVIAAVLTPSVVVDRRNVQTWTVQQNDEPTYEYSYLIHNTSHDILTVEFDLSWRLAVVAGTDAAPQTFVAVYQKTYGTTFITTLAGSLVATAVTDGVTLLDMVRELNATEDDPSSVEQYLRDLTASITATVHGQPLPTYN